jgi:hypothetical protein
MCLIDTKRFRFTFKRIPIKKVVVNTNESPYFRYLLKHKNFVLLGFPKLTNKGYEFTEGFFHAYLDDSKVTVPHYIINRVVDGYIPAFTRYAIGQNGDICARRMILNL